MTQEWELVSASRKLRSLAGKVNIHLYEQGSRLVDYPGKLKAIIWGMRTSEKNQSAIKDLLKDSTVIFRQAKRVPTEFTVAIEADPV